MELTIVFAAFGFFLIIGTPVAQGLAFSALVAMIITGIPPTHLITKMFGGVDSAALLAIPFFVLAGEIMSKAGIIRDLVELIDSIVGRVRGGLAYVTIYSSMIFSGISGSTVTDTSAVGGVLIPAMTERGYDKDFSVAVTVAASTMGPIIPPSILMIIYAHIANVSVGRMFLGGIFPGLVIATILSVMVFVVCRQRGYFFQGTRSGGRELLIHLVRSVGVLCLPILIVGGIVLGFFTATEAGVVAVVYSLLYSVLVRRSLRFRTMPDLLLRSAETSAIVLIIISVAAAFGEILSRLHFQDAVSSLLFGISSRPSVILLLILVFVLILGCFVEATAICIMFAGTFAAIGQQVGFDPVHFGVAMVFAMIIGSVTPPVAVSLYVGLAIARISMNDVMRMMWTFIPALVIALLITAFIPALVLFIPGLVFR